MATAASPDHDHDRDYNAPLDGVHIAFRSIASAGPLFATDAKGLNAIYIDSIPKRHQQVHNCSCCKRFIHAFGGLVAIIDGKTVPAMWNAETVPEFYRPAFAALQERVAKARITTVFKTKLTTWGFPETGKWRHLSVIPPASLIYRGAALTPGQASAAARENYKTVLAALADFTAPMLDEALRLLKAETLARSEKFLGPVEWLRKLQDRPKGREGENMLWAAIASAPEGYCHPRASVVGSLLEDIAAGLAFQDIKARFEAKTDARLYQRPQAAPAAGTIKQAEDLVAKLGIRLSLERRYARLDELETIWKPQIKEAARQTGGGVFDHIQPKGSEPVEAVGLPSITVTWSKFQEKVLPTASRLEVYAPETGRYIGLTSAVHPEAPPILKWDREEERYPIGWFVYPTGSPARQWGLTPGSWNNVLAVTPLPPLCGTRPKPFLGTGMILVIEGAADTRDTGNALFPECLRDDLHGVRPVIEAYSRGAKLTGRETAAAGYDVCKDAAGCMLRVFDGRAWTRYNIDRWD